MSTRLGMRQTIAGALAIVSALSVIDRAAAQAPEQGIANFYSDKFQGRKTSNGDVYDRDGLTASHKTLPFGTKVKVTNVANDKSVVVTINDRMAKSNKALIDMTRHAAQELDFIKSGTAKVTLEVQK